MLFLYCEESRFRSVCYEGQYKQVELQAVEINNGLRVRDFILEPMIRMQDLLINLWQVPMMLQRVKVANG
jgi:membrane protein YdbS with pleckstrin-like domain